MPRGPQLPLAGPHGRPAAELFPSQEVGRFTVEKDEYVLQMVFEEGKAMVLVFQGVHLLPIWGEVEVGTRTDFLAHYRVDALYPVLEALEQYVQEARVWQRMNDARLN